MKKLGLKRRKDETRELRTFVERVKKIKSSGKTVTVAIVGKYFSTGEYQLRDSYAALLDALQHASWHHGVEVKTKWIDAEDVEKHGPEKYLNDPGIEGMIVPIGWGVRGAEGMIQAAGYARKKRIPYLGLCYGMQLACVSFARDVIGWSDANTAENDPHTKHPVIHLMPAQEEIMKRRAYGGTMRLGTWNATVKKGTIAWDAYDKHNGFLNKDTGLTSERHRHRYEFNDTFTDEFDKNGLIISARSTVENLAEIIELPRSVHPFYVGTQGHPEYKSRPLAPHPIFIEYMKACLKK